MLGKGLLIWGEENIEDEVGPFSHFLETAHGSNKPLEMVARPVRLNLAWLVPPSTHLSVPACRGGGGGGGGGILESPLPRPPESLIPTPPNPSLSH